MDDKKRTQERTSKWSRTPLTEANPRPIASGIRNAPCGSDIYGFTWKVKRFSADSDLKNRGNTRDPARCIRIYSCSDGQNQLIIVSNMSTQRITDAS
jgi:hypothetical protein